MIYYSFLNYKTNTYPEEKVCVGMIFIDTDTGEYRFKVSKLKMDIAKKILPNKETYKLFKMYTDTYERIKWTFDDLDTEQRYQNGLIQWSKPHAHHLHKMDSFDNMFHMLIERQYFKE